MVNTGNNVFLFHAVDSLGHHGLMSILYLSCQLLRSQRLELLFDLCEDKFNGVELGTVRHVVDISKTHVPHGLLGLVTSMTRKLVHE